MIRWEGYAPDLDEKTPGIFTDCDNVIPTIKGFAGAPGLVPGLLATPLPDTCSGAITLKKIDQTVRFIAGTGTNLYEAAASSWTDVSRTSGGAYSASASDVRWRFAQYGDVSLAVAKSDTLQFSEAGAFEDVTDAPKASIVETLGAFVFLFDTSETIYSDSPNRWWCSAIGDYTDWTPNVSTQCATGILTATPGKITGAKRFGEAMVVYKQRAMYLGVYVGPPAIWEFRLLPEDAGAISQEVIVDIGEAESPKHIFMGWDDFYLFDGARAVPIGDARLRETVFSELKKTSIFQCAAVHDRLRSNVYFFYPVSDSTSLDKCVVYNYRTNRWGRDNRDIAFPVEYSLPPFTYADAGVRFTTYDSLPNVSYGNSFASEGTMVPALFGTDDVLYTLGAPSVTSTVTTGDYGDNNLYSFLHRVKVEYESNPTTAEMINYYKYDSGSPEVQDAIINEKRNRFDHRRSARWHRFRFNFTGDWEATGFRIGLEPESYE
jgi:hypothetical protein